MRWAIRFFYEGLYEYIDVLLPQVGAESHYELAGANLVEGVGESAPHHAGDRCHQEATRLHGAVGGYYL